MNINGVQRLLIRINFNTDSGILEPFLPGSVPISADWFAYGCSNLAQSLFPP
uniref:Uncharacterized protein n=1 Tax=Kalanchoe fedtschenkoi TaxID=63787 RepID=A0A7N0TWW0_KALFE